MIYSSEPIQAVPEYHPHHQAAEATAVTIAAAIIPTAATTAAADDIDKNSPISGNSYNDFIRIYRGKTFLRKGLPSISRVKIAV